MPADRESMPDDREGEATRRGRGRSEAGPVHGAAEAARSAKDRNERTAPVAAMSAPRSCRYSARNRRTATG